MTNKFVSALDTENTMTYTENGGRTYNTTCDALLDLFSLGGAYRSRTDAEVCNLFKKAFEENQTYAMKCLFYLRDIIEGQGERRFFRVVCKWLARYHTEVMRRNLKYVPEFGRYDDLYTFVGTHLENDAFSFMKHQLALDVQSKTPSLLAKWLKSENASSTETRALAAKTRKFFGMTSREYRKTLSILRERIKVLERLMSAGRWDEIEFDKIPSKAGMIYRNAFAKHDVERMRQGAERSYEDFMKDTTTTVNAKSLYPFEVVEKALRKNHLPLDSTERLTINKYWDNLRDVMNGYAFNGIAVADVSGSMTGTPMNVAISLAMYCAEHTSGPYAGHFFTFSQTPQFVKVDGVDFVQKVNNISRADWGMNTNVEAVFDKMLDIAVKNHLRQSEIPANVIIISDMEFDACACSNCVERVRGRWYDTERYKVPDETLFETIERKWNQAGYQMPFLTFWNAEARQDNIPMRKEGHVNYVSGFSQNIFDSLMKGLTAEDLMYEKLNNKRYACIR